MRKRIVYGKADRWQAIVTTRPMTPAEIERFNKAFEKMGEAFAELDKVWYG